MRVAAIYDIHGNLPALEAVLAAIRAEGVDRIVVGGDVVPGPMPGESIDALTSLLLPVDFIRGNGEREILALLSGGELGAGVPASVHGAMRWVAGELSPDQARLLASWPETLRTRVDPDPGEVLFCHATPRSDVELFTRVTPEEPLVSIFEAAGAPLVICGHTHMPFDRRIGSTRVVNAGSVGMPFGEPGADWLLLGPGVELRHTPYDLAAAAERIRATAYPQADEFASGNVLEPPAEAAMLEAFERAALG